MFDDLDWPGDTHWSWRRRTIWEYFGPPLPFTLEGSISNSLHYFDMTLLSRRSTLLWLPRWQRSNSLEWLEYRFLHATPGNISNDNRLRHTTPFYDSLSLGSILRSSVVSILGLAISEVDASGLYFITTPHDHKNIFYLTPN